MCMWFYTTSTRHNRLVEEADFRAAQELFGSDKTLDTLEPKCV